MAGYVRCQVVHPVALFCFCRSLVFWGRYRAPQDPLNRGEPFCKTPYGSTRLNAQSHSSEMPILDLPEGPHSTSTTRAGVRGVRAAAPSAGPINSNSLLAFVCRSYIDYGRPRAVRRRGIVGNATNG